MSARVPAVTTTALWLARTLGWLLGDVVMLGVVAGASAVLGSPWAAYPVSVVLIAVGAFAIFGWPQLALWRRQRQNAALRACAEIT